MKKVSTIQLETISGGSFIGGFCAGVSVVRFGAMVGLFAINPAVGTAMTMVVGGCIAYGIYSNLN